MNSTTFIQEIKIILSSPSKPLLEELRANAYGDLGTLIKSGFFSFANGHATVHRDESGKLRKVVIEEVKYKG